ncbi:MAG: hypothetical protein AAF488_14700, partial [Planctomycetota bacterium]
LIVTRKTKSGVKVSMRNFWLGADPRFVNLSIEEDGEKKPFSDALWKKGRRALLEGENLEFVTQVRIEMDGKKDQLFPVQREGDELWIENPTEESIEITRATLVMIDPEYFRELDGKANMSLPKPEELKELDSEDSPSIEPVYL